MMALDRLKQLYGWGEGTLGCLGFGDNRKKMAPTLHPFFENNKRVIDVACGENFTVVIAEVDGDPMLKDTKIFAAEDFERGGAIKAFESSKKV